MAGSSSAPRCVPARRGDGRWTTLTMRTGESLDVSRRIRTGFRQPRRGPHSCRRCGRAERGRGHRRRRGAPGTRRQGAVSGDLLGGVESLVILGRGGNDATMRCRCFSLRFSLGADTSVRMCMILLPPGAEGTQWRSMNLAAWTSPPRLHNANMCATTRSHLASLVYCAPRNARQCGPVRTGPDRTGPGRTSRSAQQQSQLDGAAGDIP